MTKLFYPANPLLQVLLATTARYGPAVARKGKLAHSVCPLGQPIGNRAHGTAVPIEASVWFWKTLVLVDNKPRQLPSQPRRDSRCTNRVSHSIGSLRNVLFVSVCHDRIEH